MNLGVLMTPNVCVVDQNNSHKKEQWAQQGSKIGKHFFFGKKLLVKKKSWVKKSNAIYFAAQLKFPSTFRMIRSQPSVYSILNCLMNRQIELGWSPNVLENKRFFIFKCAAIKTTTNDAFCHPTWERGR